MPHRALLRSALLGAVCVVGLPAAANEAWERTRPDARTRAAFFARLAVDGQASLEDLNEVEWDRVGFFFFTPGEEIERELGVHWDHPDKDRVGPFTDGVLVVFASGQRVTAHFVVGDAELGPCASPLVVPRSQARFTVRGPRLCPVGWK